MNKMEVVRNAGLVCSKPDCGCSQVLADSLTDEQVHDLDQVRKFVASFTDEQKAMMTFVERFFASLSPIQRISIEVIEETIDDIGRADALPADVLETAAGAGMVVDLLGARPRPAKRTGTSG